MKTVWLVLFLALAIAAPVVAHEGHDARVLGTVAAVDEGSIAVKTKEGKTVRVAVDEKTVVLRGQEKVASTDIAIGERAAVSVASRKNKHVATEIRLGAR